MKWLSIAGIAAALVGILMSCGCATTGNNQPNPAHMAALAELAAYNGTVIRLLNHPDDAERFVTVAKAIKTQLDAGAFDPIAFTLTLQSLPIKEMQSPEAVLVVGSALVLWDVYGGQVVGLDETTYVKPVMEAVYRGINRGLLVVAGGSGGAP